MAFGVLGELIAGLATLFDVVNDGEPRSRRYLIIAWTSVLAIGAALWHWRSFVLARGSAWLVALVVLWALFCIYLINASISSWDETSTRRSSKSRRAS